MTDDFLPIGMHVDLILNRLRCDMQVRKLEAEEPERGTGSAEQQSDKSNTEKEKDQRAEMERRVRDILAMENRLRRKSRE